MRDGSMLTSKSLSEGHPDKIADQISDHIIDAFLVRNPDAHVACEALLADQLVVVASEFRTRDEAIFRDIGAAAESVVRQTLADTSFTDAAIGIDPKRCRVPIAYAIGTVEPVSFPIDTQGTGALPDEQLEAMAMDAFRLAPQAIIYAPTEAYGHFGRDELSLPSEQTEAVAQSVSLAVAYPLIRGAWISQASSAMADVECAGSRT